MLINYNLWMDVQMLISGSRYVQITGMSGRLSWHSIPVQEVTPAWLAGKGIRLDILRLDKLHPLVSGNKWFKLKHHLIKARFDGFTTLLSFGGAWSNHIHALAAAGRETGIRTLGVIRGERPRKLSETLKDVESWDMQLHFVSRSDYRLKHDPGFQSRLLSDLGLAPEKVLIIPEGGSGKMGVRGSEEILAAGGVDPGRYHEIWLACGTGATMAGVIRSTKGEGLVRGVAVLKGGDFLRDEIGQYLRPEQANWQLETQGHCGGYGRTNTELVEFIQAFELDTGVPLDQVYVGKVLLQLKKKIDNGWPGRQCRLLVIHTGGLQGKRGLQPDT
ncbi:MAG: 1-aminocyclopropane-1-carboxylate deaminase/D-cysteine desulfhydrase [Endozoicomonas sp.]